MDTNTSAPSPAPLHMLINVADELPSAGGGTIAAIVAGILFVAGFAATVVIYYLSYKTQLEIRNKGRQLARSASVYRPPSPAGQPMSNSKAVDMMLFDESPSRSSTPEFDAMTAPSPTHLASFRVPGAPLLRTQQQQPVVPPQPVAPTVPQNNLVRAQSYFVDSDEELLESHRRPSDPFVGGSRVHLPAATTRQYFDDM
jgi:hypothetical protein